MTSASVYWGPKPCARCGLSGGQPWVTEASSALEKETSLGGGVGRLEDISFGLYMLDV